MELAAKARSNEMRSIRMHLGDEDMREQMLKALDERGGAQELIRQQYSGRYPFELLQNADDAARESGKRGRARFLLTETALLIADNGTGFGAKQVKAICSLGRSSKGPGTSIGHKGLGFKSVGEITERPQIISADEQFQFDAARVHTDLTKEFGDLPRGQRFPIYAFPYPLDMDDLDEDAATIAGLQADGFTTIVRLPLKRDVHRSLVAEHLAENLNPRLLLFLPSIYHLELRGTDQDFSAEVERDHVAAAEQVLLITEADTAEEWHVYRSFIKPTDDALTPMGEEWTKLRELKFAIAVPLDPETNQPTLDETFPLHVYFPTEENPGFHVAVHGEWVLTMDRRRIAETAEAVELNRQMLEAVADFAAHTVAVDLVQRCGMSAESVQALIPVPRGQLDGAAGEIADSWRAALATVPFLPLANGHLGCSNEIRLLPVSIPDLDQAHELATVASHESLRPDVEAADGVSDFVEAVNDEAQMAEAEFLALLKPPTLSGAHDFYSFLIAWYDRAGHGFLDVLKTTECVITTNGDVVAPADQTIFFPRRDASLPDDIPVPIAEVPSVDDVDRLLRDLGVKNFEWRDLIREYLIPILERVDADSAERDRAMRSLRAYQSVRTTDGDVASDILGRVLIPARNSLATTTALRRANRVYFGRDWTGSVDLEEIYGPFGEAEFLSVDLPEDGESRDREESFYRMLGVVDHPRLHQAGAYDVGAIRHPHRGPLFNEWLNHAGARSCPQDHDQQYQKLASSFRLDRLEDLIDTLDPRRLLALWKQIAASWGQVYEGATHTTLRCTHRFHTGRSDRPVESLFGYTLRSRPWIPVEVDGQPEVVRPDQAWVETALLPPGIRKRIPHISESMYRTRGSRGMVAELGLIEAGRPTVDDLLDLLEAIAAEADHEGGTNSEIELAARWVQRTLHDVLSAEAELHPSPERVRVLATYVGRTCFVSQPLFVEDPTLRATWQDVSPVIVTDVGDTRFAKYLGLVKLDDEVEVLPLPVGERRDDRSLAAAERIDAAKSFIAALVHSENSKAGSRVVRALRDLELVFCDSLTLRYRYRTQEVQRDDAACHISTRREWGGRKNLSVGTAFIVLRADTGDPDWFAFGRQLAQHLGVPAHVDAITMLLKVDRSDRLHMMADRQISMASVSEAASKLQLAFDDEDDHPNVLDQLLSGECEPSYRQAVGLAGPNDLDSRGSTGNSQRPVRDHDPATSAGQQENVEPPPVNYAAVSMVDAIPVEVLQTQDPPRRSHAAALVRVSHAPPVHSELEKRRIGKRGEGIAYTMERERLAGLGIDPDLVTWESQIDELAPYDILSFDPDGQRIYIEVKSTTAADPAEPFYISQAEIVEASIHGDRYYIYRVTDVDTAEPQITRWADPMRLVKNEQGRLKVATAQMELGLDRSEG
ncbi:DUF3883 domain-containing protein [Mycolicibacterium fortuitum]|nr:DUF3883 domain-containing protein [Mycolicibacterium fortuitum]